MLLLDQPQNCSNNKLIIPTNQPGDFQFNCSVIEASNKYFQFHPTCKPRALSQQQFASSQDWEHEACATANDNDSSMPPCNKFLDRLTALVVSPFCVFHKVLLLPTYS
jgi:hypothetical protein